MNRRAALSLTAASLLIATGSVPASADVDFQIGQSVGAPTGNGLEVATFDSDGVPMGRVGWTMDERFVIGHGLDGTVRLWSSEGGAPVATLPDEQVEGPFGIPMSPDGVHAAITGGPNWSTVLVKADTLEEVWRVPEGGVPTSFSSDGRYLGTGHYGVARILDAASGEVVAEYVVPDGAPGYFFFEVEFLAGDRWVLLVDPAATPRLWDWRAGTMHELDYRAGDLVAAISHDRTRFAIGGTEGVLLGARVWDAAAFLAGDATEPTIIQPDLPMVAEALVQGFTTDGKQLITGFLDNQVRLWDLDAGEPMRTLPHDSPIGGAQLSADGRHLLVGGLPARVYTLDTDELLALALERRTRLLAKQS